MVGFGMEILFVLMLGLLILRPKRLHTMLAHVARANAELENATRGLKAQLGLELDAAPEARKTECSHRTSRGLYTLFNFRICTGVSGTCERCPGRELSTTSSFFRASPGMSVTDLCFSSYAFINV